MRGCRAGQGVLRGLRAFVVNGRTVFLNDEAGGATPPASRPSRNISGLTPPASPPPAPPAPPPLRPRGSLPPPAAAPSPHAAPTPTPPAAAGPARIDTG